jgi:O-acetyl-ADP-ribose deacetylase (regulator of RNase III)
MKKIKGDLIKLALAGEFDVIVHGCNCFCTMGAGIALQIKREFPRAYHADKMTVEGDKGKLGTFTWIKQTIGSHRLWVINAYTQYNYRGNGRLADYRAIRSAFEAIKRNCPGKRIGFPYIGAGMARGDWNVINPIIEKALDGEDFTVVEYKR